MKYALQIINRRSGAIVDTMYFPDRDRMNSAILFYRSIYGRKSVKFKKVKTGIKHKPRFYKYYHY